LAIDALKKHKDQRGATDTAILVKSMQNTTFFKEFDPKSFENCVKVMTHTTMEKGETPFRAGLL